MIVLNGLYCADVIKKWLTRSLSRRRPLFEHWGCCWSCSCCGQKSHCSPHICVKLTISTVLWLTVLI